MKKDIEIVEILVVGFGYSVIEPKTSIVLSWNETELDYVNQDWENEPSVRGKVDREEREMENNLLCIHQSPQVLKGWRPKALKKRY